MPSRLFPFTAAVALLASSHTLAQLAPIGERPAVEHHLDQFLVNAGLVPFDQLFRHGQLLFDAKFNILDGQGRPGTTGAGAPRLPVQPAFIRTSGPDANSCFGCHNEPRSGGSGDFVANVFVLAQTLDPVTESISGNFSNERNTLGMMGAGPIEMLAREMTAELHAIRDEARLSATTSGQPATRRLVAKGVDFGSVTVLPNGKIDPSQIDGVDWDLIVKPFHQKGAVVSLREFSNNAMNHHHGMQSTERFGVGTDPDGDMIYNELSVGDITAVTIYQAALGTPVKRLPTERHRRLAAMRGEQIFNAIGCAVCHVPEFTLNSRYFTEPNPYNPPGNLRVNDVPRVYRFDMTTQGQSPRIDRLPGPGQRAVIRPFTDLKRHNLNDAQTSHFANERIPQGMINGFAPASDFTIAPYPRPTDEFLTRKLWDVASSAPYGHRGDLTTMTEAILMHGGDARESRDAFAARSPHDQACLIEFLKCLQVVAP